MKSLKLLLTLIITGVVIGACSSGVEEPTLEEVVSGYDLWYVDYNKTIGNGDVVPFVSKAFTLSFLNGVLYANNNITNIGTTGKGLGIDVGTYNAFSDILEVKHDGDNRYNFEVIETSSNEIQ
ncbi:MAG: hypothetical protein ACWIPI_10590, partial [Polaribacter sp.]